MTRTTFPDGAYETYSYFGDGLLQSKTDRKNQVVQYAYDHLKRLTNKSYPNGTSIGYTYLGQLLTQVADTSVSPSETHTLTYDNAYLLASSSQAGRGTVTYSYDAADRPASYAIGGGPTASYSYYPDGSLNTIQWTPLSGQFKYLYTLAGQYATITFPNGQTRSFSYDDQGRLTQLANTHPTAGNLATYAYGYDLNHATSSYTMLGQRTSMTANVPPASFSSALTKYYYDSLYQLTRADYPSAAPFNGEVHAWSYDAIGNRLTSSVGAATQTYAYQKLGTNPNNWQRMTSDGTSSYSYDANGSATSRSGYTFGWNYENRMTSTSGAAAASYAYDYSGRRSSKSIGGVTTSYLYDGLNLVAEQSGATTTYHLFGPGIDEPLTSSRGSSVIYHAVDALGSVTLSSDTSGASVNNYIYDAWGESRTVSETISQPLRYTAREAGDAVGTLFYRARFYAPATGRFLSEDPLETRYGVRVRLLNGEYDLSSPEIQRYLQSANAYLYVNSDPVSYRDPSGLDREGCDGLPDCVMTKRARECCDQHDLCFASARCTAKKGLPGRICG